MKQTKTIIKIQIKDGEFVECEGAEPRIFQKSLVTVNGWECLFFSDGALKCSKLLGESESKDDMAFLKISSKGYYTFAIRKNGYDRVLKKFKMDKWPDNGSLTLVTTNTGKLNASFQDERYKAFLNKHGINTITRKNPNDFYRITEYIWKNEENQRSITTIQSDGQIVRHSDETYTVDTCNYTQHFYDVEVTGATWVLLTVYDDIHDEPFTTLYTKMRREYLKGLPEKEHHC